MTEPPIVHSPLGQNRAQRPPLSPSPAAQPSTWWQAFLGNRAAILCTLFLATGCLGLPVLWKSPSFSQREKLGWTIVVLIYSLIAVALIGLLGWWCYLQFSKLINF